MRSEEHPAGAKETLAALKEGERLEVWYGTNGCFHQSKHFLVFEGRSVTVSHVSEDAEGRMKKILIAKFELTADEIMKLDKTFDRYREKPDHFSTATESLSIELWSGPKQITKEVVTKAALGESEKGGFELWQLVERTEKK